MAEPERIVDGTTGTIDDVNQLIDAMEGGNGITVAWNQVSSPGENHILKLADAAGARKLSIQDSAGVEVASVDSNGNAVFNAVTTGGNLVLPLDTDPAPTDDGEIWWDSDNDLIKVGDGAATKTFYPGDAAALKQVAKYSVATQTHSATTTLVDVIAAGSPATFTFAMAANEVWQCRYRIRSTFTGTGGLKFQIAGPASPTAVRISGSRNIVNLEGSTDSISNLLEPFPVITAFAADFAVANAAANTTNTYNTNDNNGWVDIDLFVQNGSNAGNVTLQSAQSSANGTTVHQIGCWMLATRLA